MKKIMVLSVISMALAISGCSQSVPKCGDDETVDLVKKIADQEMENQLGSEAAKLFSYTVDAIRTTYTDETTSSHECAAQLGVRASNTEQTNDISITYTVEKADDGEQFFVNVFGLK